MARIAVIIGGGTPSAALLTALAQAGVTAVNVVPEDAVIHTKSIPDTFPTELGVSEAKDRLETLEDVMATALDPGNAFANDYLLGMANGLILARSIVRDVPCNYLEMPKKEEAVVNVSTRGHRVGDMVRHPNNGIGKVVEIENGCAVVLYETGRKIVHVGTTMDDLELIATRKQVRVDEAQKAEAQPKAAENAEAEEPAEVLSRDARYDVLVATQNMLGDVYDNYVVAVTLVGITSTGAIRTYASESTGQSLNMLAQATKVLDGTLPCEDEDEGSEDEAEHGCPVNLGVVSMDQLINELRLRGADVTR